MLNSNIFKAYDIRGVYPDEITKEDAFRIGLATVRYLQKKNPGKKQLNIVVGEDCRFASPALRGAVVDAMTRAGAYIKYIGACTTPLFYFSVNKLKADGGIMITASHNPPQYGGLKIVGLEARPIGAESGLKEIEELSRDNTELEKQPDRIEEISLVNDYVDFVIANSGIGSKAKKLKLVIDAGNGMTPIVLTPLIAKLGLSYFPLYFKIDCNFPSHPPDISRDEALSDLKKKVIESHADLGIAFDGDGDRVVFIDNHGHRLSSDHILGLLFKDASGIFRKPKTVYDLRFSKSIVELLGKHGYRSRVGRVPISIMLRDIKGDIGGETSGHFFFKESNYVESSDLAMLKIIKIISNSGKTISELVQPFQKYYHSGEINMELDNPEMKKSVVAQLKEKYKDGKVDELDGIMVDFWSAGWWFNLRPSNTEPLLRLVVEANTKELMDRKIYELTKAIKRAAVGLSN